MPASSPLRPAAGRGPESPRRPDRPDAIDAIAFRIVSPLLISWTELGPSMVFFVQLVLWAALKLALCNVLAYCGYRVLGYVLPILRFFSQIPW